MAILTKQRETVAAGQAPRLYQRAFDILAGQIRDGTLAGGSLLNETRVAQQFGISRAPARRALAELARSGLLEKARGRGYRVRAVGGRRPAAAPPPEAAAEASRLQAMPTWERIYGEVEQEIVARIAFASWRLNEAKLARSYGVSRTVTRDVIGRLQQRGLLRKDDSGRWYAPELTPDHVGELYELRWVLEPVALVKAAPKVPRAFLAGLRAHLEDALANAREIKGAALDALEEEIHVALLGHCGSNTLMQAITLHQSLLIAHRFLYRSTPSLFETEPFLPEHLEVIERLEAGRVAAAAEALEHHLRVSLDRAVARVDVIRREMTADDLPYLEELRRG
ncbi:MAG: hypothetical protein Kow00114_20190 [Kiloniellaceae bacterium]